MGHIIRKRIGIHPSPVGFHLPTPWDANGQPPFMDRLAFGFDAQAVRQFAPWGGTSYARPRCFATGKLPVVSTIPLLAPSSDVYRYGVFNFTPTTYMRWNSIRIRSSNVTHFALVKPGATAATQSYLCEFGLNTNTDIGGYVYGGGESASAFRSDEFITTSNWVPSTLRHAWQWAGSTLDPDGTWRTYTAKLDPARQIAINRADGLDVGGTFELSGGWPRSPRTGFVKDVYVGARAGTTLPFNGRLACHLTYCDLDDDEIFEVEQWINDRWERDTSLPNPLVHIVANDATGTHGSAITGIVDRITGIAGATTGTMPKLNTGALNGYASLLYDGDYSLKFPGVTLPADITAVMVSKRTNPSADHEFVEHGPDVNSTDGFYMYAAGNGYMGVRRGSNVRYYSGSLIAGTYGAWYTRTVKSRSDGAMMWHRNSGDPKIGSSSGSYGSNTSVTADLWVGSRNGNTAGLFTRGEFAEIRIYPGTLTNIQNTKVHEELRVKYGHYAI